MKKVTILGVEIHDETLVDSLSYVNKILSSKKPHYIVTPNPEIVLAAVKNRRLRECINRASLSIPDGIGLKIAAYILGQKLSNRITGIDFMLEVVRIAQKRHVPLFLLGGRDGTAARAAERLKRVYPSVPIAGHASGGEVSRFGETWASSDPHIIEHINSSGARIVFVAFGCPKQEEWIAQSLASMPLVQLAMAVGGSFDYLAGRISRAPAFVRALGFEWAWRLLREPKRIKRIWRAIVLFPATALSARIRMSFFYRRNVVGFIVNTRDEVLLVQRANEKNVHWQLPQGGVEKHESDRDAVLREMKEETGLQDLHIVGVHPERHTYEWSKKYKNIGGYRGQKQTIFYLRHRGAPSDVSLDSSEIRAAQWVPRDAVIATIHQYRKKMTDMALRGYTAIKQS